MAEYKVNVTFFVNADNDQEAWDEVERAVLGTQLIAKVAPRATPAPPNPAEGADL